MLSKSITFMFLNKYFKKLCYGSRQNDWAGLIAGVNCNCLQLDCTLSTAVNGLVSVLTNTIIEAAIGSLKLTSVLQRLDNCIIETYAEQYGATVVSFYVFHSKYRVTMHEQNQACNFLRQQSYELLLPVNSRKLFICQNAYLCLCMCA